MTFDEEMKEALELARWVVNDTKAPAPGKETVADILASALLSLAAQSEELRAELEKERAEKVAAYQRLNDVEYPKLPHVRTQIRATEEAAKTIARENEVLWWLYLEAKHEKRSLLFAGADNVLEMGERLKAQESRYTALVTAARDVLPLLESANAVMGPEGREELAITALRDALGAFLDSEASGVKD